MQSTNLHNIMEFVLLGDGEQEQLPPQSFSSAFNFTRLHEGKVRKALARDNGKWKEKEKRGKMEGY